MGAGPVSLCSWLLPGGLCWPVTLSAVTAGGPSTLYVEGLGSRAGGWSRPASAVLWALCHLPSSRSSPPGPTCSQFFQKSQTCKISDARPPAGLPGPAGGVRGCWWPVLESRRVDVMSLAPVSPQPLLWGQLLITTCACKEAAGPVLREPRGAAPSDPLEATALHVGPGPRRERGGRAMGQRLSREGGSALVVGREARDGPAVGRSRWGWVWGEGGRRQHLAGLVGVPGRLRPLR